MTIKPVDQLTLTKAQLEVALAEGPCPNERLHGILATVNLTPGVWSDAGAIAVDPACNGTGRVPLLPGLRKPCIGGFNDNGVCDRCQGRGWVPETDGWKVLSLLNKSLVDI